MEIKRQKWSIAAILFCLFALGMLIAEFQREGDFKIMLEASRSLWHGEDIYAISYVDGFHYLYSPLFAILIYPLTFIPAGMAGTIWKVLGFLMLARTFVIIRRLFRLKEDRMQLIMGLAFIATLLPIYSNVHLIQMSAFLLFATFQGLDLIFRREQRILGSAWLALAINIKLLPLVFVAYLVYRAQWKAFALVIFYSIILLLLPALLIGWGHNMDLNASWWRTIDPNRSINMIDLDERGFHSLTAWLSSLLTDQFGPNELHLRRNIMSLDVKTVATIINMVRGVVILSTLWFLRTMPFRKARYPFAQFHEVAAICLMVPLIFPHQQIYGFFFLLPSSFYLVYFYFHARNGFRHPWKFNVLLAMGCFAFFIVNLEIFIGFARNELWHYKTLTYGALLQLLTLAFCNPDKVQYSNMHESKAPLATVDPSY